VWQHSRSGKWKRKVTVPGFWFLGAAHETNTFLDICRRCCKQEATSLQLWLPHKSSRVEQLLQALDRIQVKIELVAK